MTQPDIRENIRSALKRIPGADFGVAAKRLLEVLGYQSERTQELSGSVDNFIRAFPAPNQNTKTEEEFREQTQSVKLIFQVTSDEIAATTQPTIAFDPASFNKGHQQSFVFFAAELKVSTCTRGQYARFTREINKRLRQPSVVLFRTTTNRLTLGFVHRRKHKRDSAREVLGTVSLIREVARENPHRAHLDILAELSLAECARWMDLNNKPHNFDGLLAAWLNKLDTEELNRKFYRELLHWFERAVKDADFPKSIPAEQHVIRLITRILFVWFIKEKGLVREEWFVQAEVKKLLKNFGGSDYYRAVLQNLFFATLNTEIGVRGFSTRKEPNHRVFSRYRYKSLIRDLQRFEALMKQTPFVNGGLFDCLDDEESRSAGGKRIDMFSDPDPNEGPRAAQARRDAWRQLNVPDALFFDDKYGLFPLLNHYKFTVEENTPIEQEVALDPELLGKVFENLLAAYIPETRDTVRKQTGSYYTPRAVVDFMVDEVLVETLKQGIDPVVGDLQYWEERLRYLLDYEDAFDDANELFVEGEAVGIVRAISELKVLDPAVGSGAFPMGILQKLTLALRRLDPENRHWKALQKERACERATSAFDTKVMQIRNAQLLEISEAFQLYSSDFGRKLYLIRNSIFGVDIQPIACQIAKLRFFISLAIEQVPDMNADNFGIKPLPNLETRFIAANSLVGLTVERMLKSKKAQVLERELNENRDHHFHTTTRRQKLECKRRDRKLREELATELKNLGLPADAARNIAHWDPYDQNTTADWFDAGYMFGVTDGFHVVIGNPPYVRQEKIKALKPQLKIQYICFTGTADLYVYFYERGYQLLRDRGVLTYISSNKYLRATYGKKLREFLARRVTLSQLIDFGDAPVFSSIAYPSILTATKTQTDENHLLALNWEPGPSIEDFGSIFRMNGFTMPQRALTPDGWRLALPAEQDLLRKIRNVGTPLGEYVNRRFYYGIKTGLNDAFVVDKETRDKLTAKHTRSAEVLKPFLRGRDIKRWRVEFSEQYLITIPSSDNRDHPWSTQSAARAERTFAATYPAIYAHLVRFRERLTRRYDQGKYWWELRACAYWHEFENRKIILGRFMNKATFAFDRERFLHNDALYMITGVNEYVVAILNSSVSWWFLCQTCTDLQNGYLQAFRQNLFDIPVPRATVEQQSTIIKLVDYLLFLKKQPSTGSKALELSRDYVMVRYFEQIIDGLVYELFLTDELHRAGRFIARPLTDGQLPTIRDISGDKLSGVRRIFERLFDREHPVRKNLFYLDSLEAIRIIEGKK